MKNAKVKWLVVAIVAAAVAAITTVVILVLRARAKKEEAWYDEEADFGYDMDGGEFVEMSEEEVDAIFNKSAQAE